MKRIVRLIWLAAVRRALCRRWLLVLAMVVLVAYLAAGDVQTASSDSGLAPSSWDVYRAVLNNWMYVGYLMLPVFAFLVGDTLLDDRVSGYGALVLVRSGGRLRWWVAKVADIALSAMVCQALLLAACVGVGAVLHGWSLAATASPLAGAPLRAVPVVLFAPLSPQTHVATRDVLLALFVALACAALVLPLVVATLRLTRAYVVPTVVLTLAIADYLLSTKGLTPWWSVVSVGREVLEGSHEAAAVDLGGSRPLPWALSIACFTVLFLGSGFVGLLLVRRTDL